MNNMCILYDAGFTQMKQSLTGCFHNQKYHDIFTLCHFVGYMFKSVVLYLFSNAPHYGPSASLTDACHLHISHQYKPTRFIILFIA